MKATTLITQIASLGLMATLAEGATLRYNGSGIWNQASSGPGTQGWGENPNNPATVGSIPTTADEARINFGGNTVTVQSAVPQVGSVRIGVDGTERGNLIIASGGTLGTVGQIRVGASNVDNAFVSTLVVQDGGTLNVGGILWTSTAGALGNISIESGGIATGADHLWWGIDGFSSISIAGSLSQSSGNFGLGTSDASTPSGGTAAVSILNGGVLALNNISSGTSIQSGSAVDIATGGLFSVAGDRVGTMNDYITASKITGNGIAGGTNLSVAFDGTRTNVTVVPEPSSALLLGLAGALAFTRRRK